VYTEIELEIFQLDYSEIFIEDFSSTIIHNYIFSVTRYM